MSKQIQHSIFAVEEEPYCVWGWDLTSRNIQFLDGIDEGYFRYIAETHMEQLETVHAARAALALRTNYYLSLETLFGLIGASLQAPDCAAGWILKVTNERLRSIARAIGKGSVQFPIKWKLKEPIGFHQVAQLVFQYTTWAQQKDGTAERFAVLWARLADDFLDPPKIAEYNSIKHGFRARSGGFALRWGIEHEYGVPPPREEMGQWQGSHFGTSFYAADPIGIRPGRDPNFALRRHSLNWLPDNTAARMLLAAMSIGNVRAFLLVENGRRADEVAFTRPQYPGNFDAPWERTSGITSMNLDLVVSEKDIHRARKEELRAILKRDAETAAVRTTPPLPAPTASPPPRQRQTD